MLADRRTDAQIINDEEARNLFGEINTLVLIVIKYGMDALWGRLKIKKYVKHSDWSCTPEPLKLQKDNVGISLASCMF